ncbi:MAG: DNA translocase FtsK 4TM domain-containing protein [Deltaproteobacteria bacterium]|nr:DNA translocase FtsK 4TM domain-containing protein [Deltaproteobacteria bacterium]
MAKAAAKSARNRRNKSKEPGDSFVSRVTVEFVGLSLLGLALYACLALATYSPTDPIFQITPVVNRAGVVGATMAGWLFGAFGWGALVVVAGAAWLGGRLVLGLGAPRFTSRFWYGGALLLVSLACLPLILDGLAPGRLGSPIGGSLGEFLVSIEELLLSSWGALLVNGFFLVLGILSITGISTGRAVAAVAAGSAVVGASTARGLSAGGRSFGRAAAPVLMALRRGGRRMIEGLSSLSFEGLGKRRNRRRSADEPTGEGEAVRGDVEWEVATVDAVLAGGVESGEEAESEAAPAGRRRARGAEPHIVDHDEERKSRKQPSQETFEFREKGRQGPFRLPDLSTFQKPPEGERAYDRDSLLMNSRILEKKLDDFGVRGQVVRVHPGPVITMYEYKPASGIKVNKIVGLTDDLAMALRALSVRIIAPLPGKSVVGIEIPNPERETVYLRSLLESDSFRASKASLPVAMGKDIFGNVVSADLARMPHLLVAGATGTGKSVFLNSFLCSMLCRATPDELKLLLVDPKLLELSIYEGIPHLIADVVTNPKRAAAALQGIVRKMEERYQMMSAVQVRSINQFNAKAEQQIEEGNLTFRLRPKPGEEEGEEVEWAKLPYIVVVIDELADLMVLAAKDVEESLQRLAQMARAAGIHLVLATQRPSVDVLTGVIKANFPSRVSFQVSSGTDSRTILDQKGSESLLGMGDMLFLPPGTSLLQRLHGAFVTEKEVSELVAYLRDQGTPEFDDELLKISREPDAAEEGEREDVDEMFDQAVAIVAETRNASISYVQRRLKVGYNRAARIVEQMEQDGMVGPQVGTRPREVFLPQADDEEID